MHDLRNSARRNHAYSDRSRRATLERLLLEPNSFSDRFRQLGEDFPVVNHQMPKFLELPSTLGHILRQLRVGLNQDSDRGPEMVRVFFRHYSSITLWSSLEWDNPGRGLTCRLIYPNTGARFPQDFELRFSEGGLPWLDLLRKPVFPAEGECRP